MSNAPRALSDPSLWEDFGRGIGANPRAPRSYLDCHSARRRIQIKVLTGT
jgi:hypothetical protein